MHEHCEQQLHAVVYIRRNLHQPGPYPARRVYDSWVSIVMARGRHGLSTFLVLPFLLKFHNCLKWPIGACKETESVFNLSEVNNTIRNKLTCMCSCCPKNSPEISERTRNVSTPGNRAAIPCRSDSRLVSTSQYWTFIIDYQFKRQQQSAHRQN